MSSQPERPAAASHGSHVYASFGSERPDAQIEAGIAGLNDFSDDKIKQIISVAVEFLQNPQSVDIVTSSKQLCHEHDLSPESVEAGLKAVLLTLQSAVRHGASKDQLSKDLMQMGLRPEHAKRLRSAWGATEASLSKVAASGTIAMNELVDMRWKFGVTASSSEVGRIGTPHVQLSLTMDLGQGQTTDVVLELSLPQFYDFLADMEKAQAYVQSLASGGGDAAADAQ